MSHLQEQGNELPMDSFPVASKRRRHTFQGDFGENDTYTDEDYVPNHSPPGRSPARKPVARGPAAVREDGARRMLEAVGGMATEALQAELEGRLERIDPKKRGRPSKADLQNRERVAALKDELERRGMYMETRVGLSPVKPASGKPLVPRTGKGKTAALNTPVPGPVGESPAPYVPLSSPPGTARHNNTDNHGTPGGAGAGGSQLHRNVVPMPPPPFQRRPMPSSMFAAKQALNNAEAVFGNDGSDERRPKVSGKRRKKQLAPLAATGKQAMPADQDAPPRSQAVAPVPPMYPRGSPQVRHGPLGPPPPAFSPSSSPAAAAAPEAEAQPGRLLENRTSPQADNASAQLRRASEPASAAIEHANGPMFGTMQPEVKQMLQVISDQHKTLQQLAATFHMQQAAVCAERLVDRAVTGLRALADGQPCVTDDNAAQVAERLMDGVLHLMTTCTRDAELHHTLSGQQ